MFFEILDQKRECNSVYCEGEFKDSRPQNAMKTWSYHSSFGKDREKIEYASVIAQTDNIDLVVPESLKKDWKVVSNKFWAYKRALKEAKISLKENCIYDFLPQDFLREYFYVKSEITKYVFQNHKRPKNYDHLSKIHILCQELSYEKLKLNKKLLLGDMVSDPKAKSLFNAISSGKKKILYDPFRSKTGRLSTTKNSFPILNFKTEHRKVVEPKNNFLLELDYNSAEIRVLLSLLGHDQPQNDIHFWHQKNVFNGLDLDRDEVKSRFFSWLYNPLKEDRELESIYPRKELLGKYFRDDKIENPFGREIDSDEYHAISYLIQSTASDLALDRAYLILKFLEDKRSNILFVVHDSVIIDMHNEDLSHLEELVSIYSNTKLGKYKINVSWGPNYGDLKKEMF